MMKKSLRKVGINSSLRQVLVVREKVGATQAHALQIQKVPHNYSTAWEPSAHVQGGTRRVLDRLDRLHTLNRATTIFPSYQRAMRPNGMLLVRQSKKCLLTYINASVTSIMTPPRKRARISSPAEDEEMEDLTQGDRDSLEEIEFRLSQAGPSSSQPVPFHEDSFRTESESPPVRVRLHILMPPAVLTTFDLIAALTPTPSKPERARSASVCFCFYPASVCSPSALFSVR